VGLNRAQTLTVAIVAVGVVGIAISLEFAGAGRTFVVVAAGIAALVSLGISILALMTSQQQARYSELSTANAYLPVILPVHDASPVSTDTNPDRCYPAMKVFAVPVGSPSQNVFVMDRSKHQAVLHLRNVGRGPAVLASCELQDHAGRTAGLVGNPVIGPDRDEKYSATMPNGIAAPVASTTIRSDCLSTLWRDLLSSSETKERTFFLRIEYRSMLPDSRADVMEAVYDPHGTGRWHVELPSQEGKGSTSS
jgi:hypothetical protein